MERHSTPADRVVSSTSSSATIPMLRFLFFLEQPKDESSEEKESPSLEQSVEPDDPHQFLVPLAELPRVEKGLVPPRPRPRPPERPPRPRPRPPEQPPRPILFRLGLGAAFPNIPPAGMMRPNDPPGGLETGAGAKDAGAGAPNDDIPTPIDGRTGAGAGAPNDDDIPAPIDGVMRGPDPTLRNTSSSASSWRNLEAEAALA